MTAIAQHWIDAEWISSNTVSDSFNPATGEVLGQWYDGGRTEAAAAIAAARRTFDSSAWGRDRGLRNQVLLEMATRFAAHAEELGTLVTKENGKKLAEGLFEGGSPSPTLLHNAAMALTGTGIAAEVAPGQWFTTYAEPAGVVGIIVPWNSPVALLIRSLAPALAAGNTVAVKMPGQTALVANLVSQILSEVESLPRGVINIFTESGNTGAPFLVASPDVEVISYTGSSPVGRIIAAQGAPTLKRMNLELGGKTPMIVFDDADLDSVVPLLASGITTFPGQFCMTGSRILVQRDAADAVRSRLAELLENVRVGDGMDPNTDMGPLIDKPNVARVNGIVEAALAYAKPIARGGPPGDPALAAGAFYRPSLLEVDDVASDIVAASRELTRTVTRITIRAAARRREPGKDQAMASPIEIVGEWLQNLLDPNVVNRLVAPDATYVSLNSDDPELKKIMPWTGTSKGPQAFLDNLGTMFTRWENQAFNVTTMFGSDENVAVFGDFRYKSHSLGKVVSSPFSLLVKVADGQVTFLQFQEDTYATASSFRKEGSWTIQSEPEAAPFRV